MLKPFLILSSFVILVGCSSTGFRTSPHNGKLYYVPPNCTQYQQDSYDSDILHCAVNGVLTGETISPADSQQMEGYKIQQQQMKDLNESLSNLNKSLAPKPVCYNFGYMVTCN